VVFLTAIFIGSVGAWLIESSRWLGAEARNYDKEYPAVRFLKMSAESFAETLARYSFDIPQMTRGGGRLRASDAVILYMDEDSSTQLKQGTTYDRRVHAELLRRLKAAGARAVFFDIVFAGERDEPDSPADTELAAALKDFGAGFIGGAVDITNNAGTNRLKILPPKVVFRKAASWGLLAFRPIDEDYGIRVLNTGTESTASLSWVLAEKLGAKLPKDPESRMQMRWLNYYGQSGEIPNFSYYQAMFDKGLPEGQPLKDKIVFIGGRESLANLASSKDSFRTPYSMLPGGRFAPGVEIHATATLNLLRGEWLTRLPIETEKRIVFWLGFVLTILLMPRAPWVVLVACVLTAIGMTLLAIVGVQHWFVWGNWLVPALVIPILVALANYVHEGRRRNAIIVAFGKYLSPAMAKEISADDVDLKPGGKVVESTIIFTDLEGFTSLSEELDDPKRLSQILATYFTQCTGHIFLLKGTIAKFIGDAVLAVWGAPKADKDQVRHAVMSAWRLHKDSDIVIDGKPLVVRGKKVRTRIGVHTGQVLAGNLGSEQRFDWTVIGDPVNLAARLESLNKHLGTSVLISDDAFQKMGPGFTTRRLGAFIMKGKAAALVIHEMLGEEGIDPVPEWLPEFNAGVAAFERGDVRAAVESFAKVIAARGGSDGPSEFMLAEIQRRAADAPDKWNPQVELHEK
jgi:adenylate cyclase